MKKLNLKTGQKILSRGGQTYLIQNSKMIGEGGTAKVYEAIDQSDGRDVAIKFFDPVDYYEELKPLFIKEAKNLHALEGIECAVDVLNTADAVSDLDHPFYVMERMSGNVKTFFGKHAKDGKKARAYAATYTILNVAAALTEAYSRGIKAHGDLSLENILYNVEDDHIVIKLADFGMMLFDKKQMADYVELPSLLPKSINQRTIRFTNTISDYLAPEIKLKGRDYANETSDLYSLGVVYDKLLQYCQKDGLRDDLIRIATEAHHLDPADRIDSVKEFAEKIMEAACAHYDAHNPETSKDLEERFPQFTVRVNVARTRQKVADEMSEKEEREKEQARLKDARRKKTKTAGLITAGLLAALGVFGLTWAMASPTRQESTVLAALDQEIYYGPGCDDGADNDYDTFTDKDDFDCYAGYDIVCNPPRVIFKELFKNYDAEKEEKGMDGYNAALRKVNEHCRGLKRCDDGIDNDRDGLTDREDFADCYNTKDGINFRYSADNTETREGKTLGTCADGLDNDGDGLIDSKDTASCYVPLTDGRQIYRYELEENACGGITINNDCDSCNTGCYVQQVIWDCDQNMENCTVRNTR